MCPEQSVSYVLSSTWLLIQFGRDVRMIFPEPIIGCGFSVVVPGVNIRPELK
jgi:hypothetical protein